MTNTTIQPGQDTAVTEAGRAAGIRRRIEHGYWRLYHLPRYVRVWQARRNGDPDALLKLVRLGPVPDPGLEEDEPMAFHAGPASLAIDEDGELAWEWDQPEDPDLGEEWKTYADWLPTATFIN